MSDSKIAFSALNWISLIEISNCAFPPIGVILRWSERPLGVHSFETHFVKKLWWWRVLVILFEYALMPLYVTKMGDVFEISFLLSAIIHRLTSRALMLLSFRTSFNEYASNLVVRPASSGNSGSGVDLMCFISRYTGVVLRAAPDISLVSSLVSSARSVVSSRLIGCLCWVGWCFLPPWWSVGSQLTKRLRY